MLLRVLRLNLSRGACGPVVCGSLLLLGLVVFGDGRAADATRGRELYAECAACHRLGDEAGDDALGPSLAGILNRRAGAQLDYRYSRALATSDIVWTLEALEAFIADPQSLVRGNRMAYAGISDPADRADLMAYLEEALAGAE